MIRIENTGVYGFEAAIRGMRNPLSSWANSDSFCVPNFDDCGMCPDRGKCSFIFEQDGKPYRSGIGPNDLALMKKLGEAGPDHGKFLRMITVTEDITAPLYWWKEFDTYKVGTVANSCSTMHKIADKEFTLDDFSHEHLMIDAKTAGTELLDTAGIGTDILVTPKSWLNISIVILNNFRTRYLETKDKKWWWQMIQLLPSSYNQRRTVQLNYAVLKNIYHARKGHKLDEWNQFCQWIEGLPYSELITNTDVIRR